MKKLLLILFLMLNTLIFSANDYLAKGIFTEEGVLVEGENVEIKHPLASITKMMSAIVTLEEVEKGKVSLDDIVTVDGESAGIGGSYISLRRGEKISLRDLLLATLIHSANNAAYTMGKYVGGSYEEFVMLMNEKAQELGMTDTSFYTPAGLPSVMTGEGMDTGTVEDIAKLSAYAMKNQQFMDIVGKKKVLIKKGRMTLENRNKNLNTEGVTGLKTGHHDESGYNIAVSVDRNGKEYIIIVFGSPDETTRDREVTKNIEYIYSEYSEDYLVNEGEFLVEAPVLNGKSSTVSLYSVENVVSLVKRDWKLTKSVYLPKELKAPIKKGEKVGVYIISHEDKELARVDLIAGEDIKKGNWLDNIIKKLRD